MVAYDSELRRQGISRARFAAAAALGRLLAEVNGASFGAAHGEQSRIVQTQRANAFAAEFLLPASALRRGEDLASLCVEYGISLSAGEWQRTNRQHATDF